MSDTSTKPEAPKAPSSPSKSKTIKFENLGNLKPGETANTIRVGAEAFEAGDKVDLVGLENQPLGKGEVTQVVTGKWADMRTFAPDNHTFVGVDVEPLAAQDMLKGELGRHYPKADLDKEDLTVIYFKRTE